ncbi:MAG: hypothetical protein ACR2RE_12405 [Geminicoccaceae bacterium]
MSEKTYPGRELHAAMVDQLNESEACGACKLSALAMTVVVVILRYAGSPRSAVRLSGAFIKDMTDFLGDQLQDHGSDPIDDLRSGIGDIRQKSDKRGPLN